MFIGVLLVVTWLILLLRYPAKALPVSLAAAFGLALVACWVVWLDNREAQQLALMIKNRGLKLRPTNIHDNVLTIDQQVQICKEIGGCEVMILKILTFPGDDQSEMIIFGNEIGELTYNRDNLNRFLKALNVR